MNDSDLSEVPDAWNLLAKAENRCKLGLTNEAVIIADEAVQAELATYLYKLEAPLPADRKEAMQTLKQIGVGVSTKSLLRLDELGKRAEQVTEDEDLSAHDAEEAISIAENIVTNIGEKNDRQTMKREETGSTLPIRTLDQVKSLRSPREDGGQFETDFVRKLLLAKAVLSSKKKRIPHFIGSMITILSALICFYFGLMGGSGIIMAFTGNPLFSIFGLLINLLFLLIAYLFLRIAVHVKGETR